MNKLTLNLHKTPFNMFYGVKHKINNISITLNSVPLEQESHTNFWV